MWCIGVDVGGTFTDLFGWNKNTGERVSSKVLTTPKDRSIGVLNSIRSANVPFSEISQFVHGTTTATNELIERNYQDAAMVTTEGFRDVLEIGRMHREHLYSPYQTKPRPVIRRRYRYTVPGRLTAKGEIYREFDEGAARLVAKKIREAGIRSVAVCFINSYVNSMHEQLMKDILLEEIPGVAVACSGEIPVFREHGRFTTTAIRAALMPTMQKYFDRIEEQLRDAGFLGTLQILKSSGGLMSVDIAREHPEELIESGPAGGVSYAAYLSEITKFDNILHTDVGGTSFDASMVVNGRGLVTRNYELEWDVPVVIPMLDIHSVGAGGGSIAWVDEGGSLRVGPQSASSEPGPACYGRGGTEPTMTDANLLLGRLEPTLGEKFSLDREAAERAIASVAKKVGLSVMETAEGIVRIGCETMAHAVKKVVAARGRDPRDFVMASFGGAGPMHACFVAEAMAIPKVVVPAYAGVASAFGATAMDLRHDIEAFHYTPVAGADLEKLNKVYTELEDRGYDLLKKDEIADNQISYLRTAQMRYEGQTYEVEVAIPSGVLDEEAINEIVEQFNHAHKVEYGVSSDEFSPVIVSVGVAAIGKTQSPPLTDVYTSETSSDQNECAIKSRRDTYFDGKWHEAPVFNGTELLPNSKITGPAIIEYDHSCAVLPPKSSAEIDQAYNLIINLSE